MIDSISIAATGLRGYEAGLRTISNNTANLNTPGFKGSSTEFADLAAGGNPDNPQRGESGLGLNTLGSALNFASGQLQSTSDPLDLAIDGQGFFTLKDTEGQLRYTQDGEFKFNDDGVLVSSATGDQVMAAGSDGALSPISLADLQTNPAQATTSVSFSGNLSSTTTSDSISNITVIDPAGTSHTLTLTFKPVSGTPGSWTASLMDGTTSVGTATLAFNSGQPVARNDVLSFTYTPSGGSAMSLDLDFSSNVTSFDTGATSTLAVTGQNGFAVGSLTGKSFDSSGTLVLTYSNGQTVKKSQLALAQFASPDDVESVGNNAFAARAGTTWQTGVAGSGQFGNVQSSMIETSNVDLSQEFSSLVIMQQGYQACSQVVSTASSMLTSLFGMFGK